jgi:hypothetical protein
MPETERHTAFEVEKHLHRNLGVITTDFHARKARRQLSRGDARDAGSGRSNLVIAALQIAAHSR